MPRLSAEPTGLVFPGKGVALSARHLLAFSVFCSHTASCFDPCCNIDHIMSTVGVGQPSPPTQSSHQPLPVDDVEPSGFRPRPAPRDYSRMPIIVVDDDSYPEAERRVRSYRPGSMNGRPPATARRVAYDSSVTVIGDTGVVGSSQNRRTRNGAQSRPIVVLDSDEEQGQPSGLAGSMPRTRRTRGEHIRGPFA
jgi:hypothetical protein